MRRILLALLGLVLTADLVAVAIGPDQERATATPTSTTSTTSTTATTATTLPPTTTTTVAPPRKPVSAPHDPNAAEPIRTIGRIDIPKLGLSADLGEGISLRNIDRGPSHWPGTAMPGQNGNVVVAGHRVTHTRPFRNIDLLVPGDEVFFTVDGVRWRYVMTGSQVVTPRQTEIVAQTPDPQATLFACHPPGSARYRYVVHLKLA
jgi:sortase A